MDEIHPYLIATPKIIGYVPSLTPHPDAVGIGRHLDKNEGT